MSNEKTTPRNLWFLGDPGTRNEEREISVKIRERILILFKTEGDEPLPYTHAVAVR